MYKVLSGFLAIILALSSVQVSAEMFASKKDTLPPVEKLPPNSQYKPAFSGQTRIGGVKTSTPYEGKVLSTELQSPWAIACLPDGRFLITEKRGVLRISTPAGKLSDSITGLPAVNLSGQGGLLGLTIDPEFATNRMIYWTFSEEERLLTGENQRFRDITQGKDGALYTITDQGRLYRIGKK